MGSFSFMAVIPFEHRIQQSQAAFPPPQGSFALVRRIGGGCQSAAPYYFCHSEGAALCNNAATEESCCWWRKKRFFGHDIASQCAFPQNDRDGGDKEILQSRHCRVSLSLTPAQ